MKFGVKEALFVFSSQPILHLLFLSGSLLVFEIFRFPSMFIGVKNAVHHVANIVAPGEIRRFFLSGSNIFRYVGTHIRKIRIFLNGDATTFFFLNWIICYGMTPRFSPVFPVLLGECLTATFPLRSFNYYVSIQEGGGTSFLFC